MHMLQSGLYAQQFDIWTAVFRPRCAATPPIHLRDLLDFKPLGKPLPIEEVESITASASGSSHPACRWEL